MTARTSMGEYYASTSRPDVAREALADLAGFDVDELDLGDLESVRAFSDRFLASDRGIGLMINNAYVRSRSTPAASSLRCNGICRWRGGRVRLDRRERRTAARVQDA